MIIYEHDKSLAERRSIIEQHISNLARSPEMGAHSMIHFLRQAADYLQTGHVMGAGTPYVECDGSGVKLSGWSLVKVKP